MVVRKVVGDWCIHIAPFVCMIAAVLSILQLRAESHCLDLILKDEYCDSLVPCSKFYTACPIFKT